MKIMNRLGSFNPRLLAGTAVAVIGVVICALCTPFVSAGPPTAPEKPVQTSTASGATLYAIHCNRCHPERYATEFTAAHWKNIMIHMRVRANLPAAQAEEILKYLQQDAGQ
jgi:hypothetical protein